ncbi:MAG: amidohydrolase [Thaumarchaeota archaeon]|nr:amidohydrolase [Nitrososphaerota archaeon]
MEFDKGIDIHTHVYPSEYLKYLEQRTEYPKIVNDPTEGMVIWDNGVRAGHVDAKGHVDVDFRVPFMENECGIGTQAVSLTVPGTYTFGSESVKWARWINDYYAKLDEKFPGKYACFMTLPLNDVGASLDEMERAHKDLGLRGVGLFTNVFGKYLDDPEFHPIFEKVSKLGLPAFVHPATPVVAEFLGKYKIPVPLWGYTYETTIFFTRLVWNGVLDKFPNLNFIATHLGGFIPYQFERIDYAFRGYSREFGYKLSNPPSYYFKRMYYDAVNFHKPSVMEGIMTFGADRILLGTDYAHRVGDPKRAVPNIKELPISDNDKEKILYGTARKLLGIS